MSARLLIVEDEDALATLLDYNLSKEGFLTERAADGQEALLRVEEARPDLVILDWMLPKVSGVEVCRQIRARPETRATPVLMLTARGEESDRVRGLDTGADDYLVKPFGMAELAARVRALLRRASPELVEERLTYADLVMDRGRHRVTRAGLELHLGPTEYRLLEFLLQRPGRVFSRERLLDAVWGSDIHVEARTVDVHIGRLRKAITPPGAADLIRTVRGAGYSLDERN
jgi:phosphate regulon transcriptional regulatory protein PhoB